MEAVIFDMDGVIVDSEPLNDEHESAYFQKLGIDIAKLGQRSFRGTTARTQWAILKTEFELQESVEVLVRRGRASYLAFLEALPEIPMVEGVDVFIEELARTDHNLALGSSANPRRIDLFLRRLNLRRYFEIVVSGDDVTHGKPDPEVFRVAATRLGAAPQDCIVIEDSTAGVSAAKAADMKCIGFAGLPDNQEDLSRADTVVTDFSILTTFVRQGNRLAEFLTS